MKQVMRASGRAGGAGKKTPRVVMATRAAMRPASASKRARASAWTSSTVATTAAAEGRTAVSCVTCPAGQETSAISHARSGGLLKYPTPLSRGQSQSPRVKMSCASSGKRASSFEVKTRAPSSTPSRTAAASAIHGGAGGQATTRASRLDKAALPAIVGAPALEDEERPEGPGVVPHAGPVLRDEPADRDRVEHAARAQARLGQELMQHRRERAAQPGADRHPEALLAAGADLGREPIGEGVPEQPLEAAEAPELQPGRDPPDQLDERVIEQRRA